jgi:AcrR family transcriptional regulator
MIDAARKVFGAKGYEAATTMEIAKTAGVAHALIFRHFNTKAQLFEEAVFEPFQAAVSETLAKWSTFGAEPHPARVSSEAFVSVLFGFLRENADLVAALATSPHYDGRVREEGGDSSLSLLMDTIAKALETEIDVQGWSGIDGPIATRISFCAILGITFFDRWVFPQGERHPHDDRIQAELQSYISAAFTGRGAG